MKRDETIKWLESLKAEIGKSEHRSLWHYAEPIDMAIEALQTIDNCDQCEWCCPSDGTPTIHVVRCKDCRWYRDTFLDTKITPTCDRHIDDRYGTLVGGITGESFCSYGERREK